MPIFSRPTRSLNHPPALRTPPPTPPQIIPTLHAATLQPPTPHSPPPNPPAKINHRQNTHQAAHRPQRRRNRPDPGVASREVRTSFHKQVHSPHVFPPRDTKTVPLPIRKRQSPYPGQCVPFRRRLKGRSFLVDERTAANEQRAPATVRQARQLNSRLLPKRPKPNTDRQRNRADHSRHNKRNPSHRRARLASITP